MQDLIKDSTVDTGNDAATLDTASAPLHNYPPAKVVCQLDDNGYYTGPAVADLSPLEAEQGVYLLPAGCVDTAPPEEQLGMVAWWDEESDAWQHHPDHRGQTVYRTDDGEPLVLDRPGEYPPGTTVLPRPDSYHTFDAVVGNWVLTETAAAQQAADAAVLREQAATEARQYLNEFGEKTKDNYLNIKSIDELRSLANDQLQTVVVAGYYTDQPGLGGGVFVAAPDDHTTADNGSTVIVGADGMRWVRVGGKHVGLSEIGVTDTLGAPETAQRISAALAYDGIQELDFDLSADYTFALSDKQALAGLGKIKTRGDVVCQLPAGVFELNDPITFVGSQSLTLAGAPLTEYVLPAQTPAVAAVDIAGNRYQYNITLQLPGHALVAGDVVAINTTGRTLTAVDYDVTVAGSLHYLLRGAFVVVSVTAGSITVANMSRQSQDKFPGVAGSDYAANLLQVTGGVVRKFNTVMKCGKGGIVARGLGHKVRDIAFVSTSSTAYTGCDLFASGLARSLDLQTVAFIGFGLYGVNADGPVEMAGEGVYVTAAGSNGIRAARRASVNLPRSAAHGCGVTAGNGFFATTGGSLTVDASIAHGCRNTGFIANRGGYVYCENTVSAHNGNYADDAAGGFSDSEGKGYESEVGGTVVSSGSHALCNLSMGFYCLAGSKHTAIRAFACGSMHAHGFYALGSSELYTRYSVAASNKGRGYYAYENSRISALNTTAAGNVSGDYVAQGASTITAIGHTNSAAQFLPNINTNGANQIITSNAFEFPAKLVASKGGNLTIANGAITVTDTWHIVDTEGRAASDDLDTINGGVGGQILIIRALTSSRKIVLKNGTGNLAIGKDLILNHLLDTVILMYENAANRWVLLAFGDNAVLG